MTLGAVGLWGESRFEMDADDFLTAVQDWKLGATGFFEETVWALGAEFFLDVLLLKPDAAGLLAVFLNLLDICNVTPMF